MIEKILSNLLQGKIIAHRGASGYAPENTLAAMRLAKVMGARAVEFDVRLTACGELVVFHDDVLHRTTNGKGVLREQKYHTLKILDAGLWYGRDFINERIPLLSEMLHCLIENELWPNIEIKCVEEDAEVIASKLLDILQNCWPSDLPPPLISSFSIKFLQAFKRLNTFYPLGLLLNRYNSNWLSDCQNLQCVSVHVEHSVLNEQWADEIKSSDYILLAYTVNEMQRANILCSIGVDAVFCDYPDMNIKDVNIIKSKVCS